MSVEATIEAYLRLPLEENRCLRFLFCNYNAPLTSSHPLSNERQKSPIEKRKRNLKKYSPISRRERERDFISQGSRGEREIF